MKLNNLSLLSPPLPLEEEARFILQPLYRTEKGEEISAAEGGKIHSVDISGTDGRFFNQVFRISLSLCN